MAKSGAVFTTHNTAPAFLIFVVQNGDHDLGSGSDVDLWPLERVAVMITKVDTKSQFCQVGKVRSLGGHVQSVAAGLVRRNNDDIVGTIGLSPVEGDRFAL